MFIGQSVQELVLLWPANSLNVCLLFVSAEIPFLSHWNRLARPSTREIQEVLGHMRPFSTSMTSRNICTLSEGTWSTWCSEMFRYWSDCWISLRVAHKAVQDLVCSLSVCFHRILLRKLWSAQRCLPCLHAYPLFILQSLLSYSQSCSSATSCISKTSLLYLFACYFCFRKYTYPFSFCSFYSIVNLF